MTSCERIVPPYRMYGNILTNNSTLQVNTGETTVGTITKLSCLRNYTLQAESPVVECLSTGKWNYTNKPTCVAPTSGVQLTTDQKIILGVAGGVGCLVLIILIVMLCLIFRAKRDQKKKSAQGNSSDTGTPRPDVLGQTIDTYPQRYPYPESRDFKHGYGNHAYLYSERRDFGEPRKEYLKDIHSRHLPPPNELSNVSLDRRYPTTDPLRHQRRRVPPRRFQRESRRKRRHRGYRTSVSSGTTDSLHRRYVPREPPRYRGREAYPRRNRRHAWKTYLDTSFKEPLPPVDYEKEFFDYPDEPIQDPLEIRTNPDVFHGGYDNRRLPVTNAVRMYEAYGRPSRLRMLEEAYALQNPYHRPAENSHFGRNPITSRSADMYGLRGDDPTRYYRGYNH